MNDRMDRSILHIGAYTLAEYARSEEHIRDIARCGIDMMIGVPNDSELLDQLYENGIGAVVSGVVPGWFGGMGENAGTMHQKNPLELYRAAALQDHPAIWGIDIGDEPSSEDFPHYGRVFETVKERFPSQFPYLNLYPSYAMVPWNTPEQVTGQLGVQDYEAYIARYCEQVKSDYICFDFYPYAAEFGRFLRDLNIVSTACRKTGRSLWIVLQVNSHDKDVWTSANRLRLQAYSALAFGAESIFWACYTAGWWHNQVLDAQGNKTQQYDKLRLVNAELKSLGETYMRYRNINTCIVQEDPLNYGGFRDVRATSGERLIVGEMVSRYGDGASALMICAANDPLDEHPGKIQVNFSTDYGLPHVIKGGSMVTVKQDDDEVYSFEMDSCSGAMLILEDDE